MKFISDKYLDDGSRRLMARAAELVRREAYDTAFSDFLTPREQRLFYAACAAEGQADRLFFYGGAPGAERRIAVLVPEWLLSDVPTADPFGEVREQYLSSLIENETIDTSSALAAVSLTGSDYGSLTHRDWLGAILALGIERHVLGDIAVFDEHRAFVFLKPSMVPFVTENLTHAGSDTVRAAAVTLPDGFEIPRSFERIEASVASPRLDGVVRALTNLSRSDAASLVLAGDVELNYFPEEKTDAPVEDGDTLSIRGYGKYIIDSANTVTRRGRNRLVARKYK